MSSRDSSRETIKTALAAVGAVSLAAAVVHATHKAVKWASGAKSGGGAAGGSAAGGGGTSARAAEKPVTVVKKLSTAHTWRTSSELAAVVSESAMSSPLSDPMSSPCAGAGGLSAAAGSSTPLDDVTEAKQPSPVRKKKVRVYIDGCFDMMHYGHSNALRQARACGDELVVGLINDDEIVKNKGSPPVMPQSERLLSLQACKFVNEVIEGAPYDLHKDWVDTLVRDHDIDFVVHGDDPCITADGKDAYAYAKSIGRFKLIKRTEGVSTTDIVGRMLLMSREHHVRRSISEPEESAPTFLPTSRRITQFSSGRAPTKDDVVVYIGGSWDLFNVGHIKALEVARTYGTFLLVGVHDDDVVNRMQGSGYPILNLHERTLSVLACKYVDEVIIGAPADVSKDMIRTMNISVVVKGTVSSDDPAFVEEIHTTARDMGILKTFTSPSQLRVPDIVARIISNREVFTARQAKKAKSEAAYYAADKAFHAEA